MIKYLHTINDIPAYFDGKQIVAVVSDAVENHPTVQKLADSIDQILAEQKLTEEFRSSLNIKIYVRYGYLKVIV